MLRICFLLTMAIALNVSAAPTSLKIQDVAEMALKKGLYQKDIELNYQKSEISLLLTESNFDTQFGIKGQREDSKAVAPGALTNPRDQTQSFGLGLSRKFVTGSMLGIDYSYVHRESDLSNFMKSAGLSPIQYYHLTTLTFKQDLLNNAFGFKDRRQSLAANLQFERAQFEREEASEELVLQAIKLYLDAFFAQENLKQNLAARDKYLLLYKNIQQKNKMGFDDRSELIKTKAELQNQEKNVKSATLLYQTLIDKLYTILNSPQPTEVVFEVPEVTTPPILKNTETKIENLRKSKSIELLVEATLAEKEAAANNEGASLNFFTQAAFSGLDKTNSVAVTQMSQQEKPKYTIGLEYAMRWGGSAQKAESISKLVAHEEALNARQKVKNSLQELIETSERNLQSKYTIVINADETVKIWDEAMKSQERNHRFGRITTAELLMDYGSYFRAKSALSGAIADYQLALYEYQAARDELIKSKN